MTDDQQRAHEIAAWQDAVAQDEANDAACAAVLAKLQARHPCHWLDVFETLYVDGEPHRVYLDRGIVRFCGNPITRRILDTSPYTLNDVVRDYGRSQHSRNLRRFYIEIGYSLDGFLELEENAFVHLSLTPPEAK